MKRAVFCLTAVFMAATAAPLSAQVVKRTSPVKQEYNQSRIDQMRLYYQLRAAQMRAPETRYVTSTNPGEYVGKGFVNTFFFHNTFGINSFFSRRIRQDLYLVGEFGYFSKTRDNVYPSMYYNLMGRTMPVSSAMLFPLYAGVRRGVTFINSLKRLYPYVGAGAGPVLGVGNMPDTFRSHYSVAFAPSLYAIAGTEIYAHRKWMLDFNIRYRYLRFHDALANWRNFSGVSFAIGFGYGGGGMQYLR